MGKTVFNPITTKWRGAIGGFRYSVVRGKQVIAERASAVKNPNTVLQRGVRARFKLASQFSAKWADILNAFLRPFVPDDVIARSEVTQTVFKLSGYNEGDDTAAVNFASITTDLNNKHNTPASISLTADYATGATVTGAAGETILYQVNAYNAVGQQVGSNRGTVTIPTGETSAAIQWPLTAETPSRYDVIAYSVTPNTEEAAGSLADILATPTSSYEVAGMISTIENVTLHGLASITVERS